VKDATIVGGRGSNRMIIPHPKGGPT